MYYTDYLDNEQGWTSITDIAPADDQLLNYAAARAQAIDLTEQNPNILVRVSNSGDGSGTKDYYFGGQQMIPKIEAKS